VLRTGKGGRYRYYACTPACRGGKRCQGQSIRMERLDDVVISAIEERVLDREHAKGLMAGLIERQQTNADGARKQKLALQREKRDTRASLDRLYQGFANGAIPDSDTFRRQVSTLEAKLEDVTRQIGMANRAGQADIRIPSDGQPAQFAATVSQRLRQPGSRLAKRLVTHLVDRIDVGPDEIKLTGSNAALLATAASQGAVPSSVQEWWARQDSNLQPDRYERSALTN
jgi:site-specific DNA recombinase